MHKLHEEQPRYALTMVEVNNRFTIEYGGKIVFDYTLPVTVFCVTSEIITQLVATFGLMVDFDINEVGIGEVWPDTNGVNYYSVFLWN